MLNIEINETMVKEMLQTAINDRIEELAKQKYFMTFKELEKYLNLSRPTIIERFLKNGMKYYRVGDRYLFKRDEVDSFLDAMTREMNSTQNDIKFFNGLKGGEK